MHAKLAKSPDKGAKGRARLFKRLALLLVIFTALVPAPLGSAEKGIEQSALEVYLEEQASKPAVRQQLELRFRRPFERITQDQYAAFMKGLDLNNDEDMFHWSHVTDIPIVALRKSSFFSA